MPLSFGLYFHLLGHTYHCLKDIRAYARIRISREEALLVARDRERESARGRGEMGGGAGIEYSVEWYGKKVRYGRSCQMHVD
jgi:hypothetical protein